HKKTPTQENSQVSGSYPNSIHFHHYQTHRCDYYYYLKFLLEVEIPHQWTLHKKVPQMKTLVPRKTALRMKIPVLRKQALHIPVLRKQAPHTQILVQRLSLVALQ